MTTYQASDRASSQPLAAPTVVSKRVMRQDRISWRTSTLPMIISLALLTALATAIALGFRELVRLAMAVMGG